MTPEEEKKLLKSLRSLSALGWTTEDIQRFVRLDKSTLQKYLNRISHEDLY